MDKVKVSREVAEVLNTLEKTKLSRDAVLRNYATFLDAGVERKTNPCQTFVNDGIDLLGLAEILVKGYEVEQTPAERLAVFYQRYDRGNNKCDLSYAQGIRFALDVLNIEVPGVNITPSKEQQAIVKDYPTEDVFGSEIVEGDRYFIIGDVIVLNQNLDVYITEYLHGQICKAK